MGFTTDLQLFWLTRVSTRADITTSIVLTFLACLLCYQVFSGTDKSSRLNPIKFVQNRIKTWQYLLQGQKIIQDGYEKSGGKPYEVLAPDNRYVFVSDPKYIRELDKAPDNVLSLQGAAKQMLQPVYTMQHFNWFVIRGTEGVGFIRALRTLLTNNLPEILPDLSSIIRSRMAELRENHPTIKGEKHSPVYPMIVKLVVLSNAVSFFGKDLAKNDDFMESALQYIEQTLICAEIVRLLPKFMAPIVGNLLGARLKAQDVIFNTLIPIAEQRVVEREAKAMGQEVPHHPDCIQWIMDTSPRQNPWSAERVVHELMAIWFGSVHAVSTTITFAIHDLCLHPEYLEPLRNELIEGYTEFERTSVGLPLLDSFIKESARLTPVEAQSSRRSVLKPFTFSDGTKLAVGEWACTPVRSIMQDSAFYPSPLDFNGFRFANPAILGEKGDNFNYAQPKPSKLTDCDNTFHVWGTGRMACPGRWYATAVMKVIMGQVILHYDCEMVEQGGPRFFEWRSTILPRSNTMIKFTPLASQD